MALHSSPRPPTIPPIQPHLLCYEISTEPGRPCDDSEQQDAVTLYQSQALPLRDLEQSVPSWNPAAPLQGCQACLLKRSYGGALGRHQSIRASRPKMPRLTALNPV